MLAVVSITLTAAHAPALFAAQQRVPDTAPAQPTSTAPLAFAHVTVVDVTDGRLIPDQTVVVVGNRIDQVGPTEKVPLPQGAIVVDASGKYLLPGFWDMFILLDDSGISHVDALAIRLYNIQYPYLIAHGVTGIRELAQRFPAAVDSLKEWQKQVMSGTRIGPRNAGLAMNEYTTLYTRNYELEDIPLLKSDGFAYISYFTSNDNEPIQEEHTLPREVFFAIARNARNAGIDFVGQVPRAVTSTEAADSGMSSLKFYPAYPRCLSPDDLAMPDDAPPDTEERCAPLAKAVRDHGTWLVPTLAKYKYWDQDADTGQGKAFVRMMRTMGVKTFLAGTNYYPLYSSRDPKFRPGLSSVEEMILLAGAGLTPLEALQAATLNPARALKATDSLGMVAPGKLADLVLLDANPLTDIRNVLRLRATVANGRYFNRAALDALDPVGTQLAQQYDGSLTPGYSGTDDHDVPKAGCPTTIFAEVIEGVKC